VISTHRERQIARAGEALTARGGGFVDLPTLLPASLVLELAGEGLRPRLFFATAPDGTDMCLRPDLTIPAVTQYIADSTHDNDLFAWACNGRVFRAPRFGEDRPPEFVQIGLERFGDPDIVQTDVTIFLAAWNACQAAEVGAVSTRFCDGGLLPAIIAQADLPDIWCRALAEHVGHRRAFLGILDQASGKTTPRVICELERELVALSSQAAIDRVEQALSQGNLTLAGGRTVEDITQRLVTRGGRALAAPLPAATAGTLSALANFAQTSTVTASLDHVVALAARLGVNLDIWRSDWLARFTAIKADAPTALTDARFDALGDEAFDYYDGMAFDIATSDDFTRPVATGGRYDRLVGEISRGTRHARAIGCVIRPDRFGPDANGEA
jgi:ATP phosphoribosyltransferase regulatory subunit